jgi:hypothetical protein
MLNGSFRRFFIFALWIISVLVILLQTSSNAFAIACKVCGTDEVQLCGNCFSEAYCGPEHQRQCWASHRQACHALKGKLAPYQHQIRNPKVKFADSFLPGADRGLMVDKKILKGQDVALYFGKIKSEHLNFSPYGSPHSYRMTDGKMLVAKREPRFLPFLSGHMVNDPYMQQEWLDALLNVDCRRPDTAKLLQVAKGYLAKHVASGPRQNVDIVEKAESFPVFVALRDLEEGEELYFPAGLNYWMAIPQNICSQKGFPTVSLDIKAIMIKAVEGLPKTQAELAAISDLADPKDLLGFPGIDTIVHDGRLRNLVYLRCFQYMSSLYMPNATQLDLDKDRQQITLERRRIALRLASLLRSYNILQLSVTHTDLFRHILDKLDVETALEHIGDLPNSEFYSVEGFLVHPRAKALLLSIMEHQDKIGIHAFEWVDMTNLTVPATTRIKALLEAL